MTVLPSEAALAFPMSHCRATDTRQNNQDSRLGRASLRLYSNLERFSLGSPTSHTNPKRKRGGFRPETSLALRVSMKSIAAAMCAIQPLLALGVCPSIRLQST